MDVNVIDALNSISLDLRAILSGAGVDDLANDPMVKQMVSRWTATMQGSSLLEAVVYLFVGSVAIKGVLNDAIREACGEPPVRLLDDLGVPAAAVPGHAAVN